MFFFIFVGKLHFIFRFRVNLKALKRAMEDDLIDMEIIVNNKTLDDSVNCIQLEEAVGAAMKCFNNCCGVKVPRSRFLPVKKTSDLFLIMSNLYALSEGALRMSPDRMFLTTPLIKLGDQHFKKVRSSRVLVDFSGDGHVPLVRSRSANF